MTVDGIVGFIRLIAGKYLVVIRRSEEIGKVNGSPINKVLEASLLPLSNNLERLSEELQRREYQYTNNFSKFLESFEFYFSHHYPLTHSLQRAHLLKKKYQVDSLSWRHADSRFFWNRNLVKDFFDSKFSSWIVPLVDGCSSFLSLSFSFSFLPPTF